MAAIPDVRRFAALDMPGRPGSLRRRRIIRAEFVLGCIVALALAAFLLANGAWLIGFWLLGVQPPELPGGQVRGASPASPIPTSSGGTSLWAFALVAVAAALLTLAVVGSWQAYRRARRRTARSHQPHRYLSSRAAMNPSKR